MSDNSYIYFDNNATTVVDPLVLKTMLPYLNEYYGNPNSNHFLGKETHTGLEIAANQFFKGLNIPDQDTLVMTACATESINTVHKSVLFDFLKKEQNHKNQILTSYSEHSSMKKSLEQLEDFGIQIISIDSDNSEIFLEDFYNNINPYTTLLVSLSLADSETGMIHPVKEISEYCNKHNILLHIDATQAVGKICVDVKELKIDFLSFSGHKFHGPKGIGGLYIRKNTPFTPLLLGGNQMGGFRAGTLNTAGIIGTGKALEIATLNINKFHDHTLKLKNILEDFLSTIPECIIYGKEAERLPNTTFFNIKHLDHDFILWHLDQHNIAASTGSACSTKNNQNTDLKLLKKGIRISLSRYNTQYEVEKLISVIKKII